MRRAAPADFRRRLARLAWRHGLAGIDSSLELLLIAAFPTLYQVRRL
jgi:hypothetical protein